MTTYGYIRTSRDQETGHPGSDPHGQRRQLVEGGVVHARIYADVAASGAKDYYSRDQWHVLDQQLGQGDVPVVAAADRLGRRYLETMWAIYDLPRRGIRLRSLAGKEDLCWVVSVDGRRLYELLHGDDPQAFYRALRTLEGAIREAELYWLNLLIPIWQGHLARQFGREALTDFDCPE